MIFAGYENGRYFVRLTHDMKIVEAMGIFNEGYKLFGAHMLLLKDKTYFTRETEFSLRSG